MRIIETVPVVIVLIGLPAALIKALMLASLHTTSLLYIGVPYLVALGIATLRPYAPDTRFWHRYTGHLASSMVVLLGTSVLLGEGFLCVLFIIPIYVLGITVVFLIDLMVAGARRRHGRVRAAGFPVLILLLSMEGTAPSLSFPRDSHVEVVKTTHLSPQQVMDNLARPFRLDGEREWLLSVFPMPYEIDAGSLGAGDVHVIRTRYKRWFVANVSEGEAHLKIVDVEPFRVRTRFVHDSTYLAAYLTPIGTEINLRALRPGATEIRLRVDYRRKLDPAWYFHPLQQLAVGQMAGFLIDEIMVRDDGD